jgi:hypothetical protein
MKEINNIDDLIRDVSKNWEVKPPVNSFKKIRKGILLANLKELGFLRKKYLFSSMNILIVSVISIFIIAFLLLKHVQPSNGRLLASRHNRLFEESYAFRSNNSIYSSNINQKKIRVTEKNIDQFEKTPQQSIEENDLITGKTNNRGNAMNENKLKLNEYNYQKANEADGVNISQIHPNESDNSGNETQSIIDQNTSETFVNEWNPFYLQMIRTGNIPVYFAEEIGNEVFVGKQTRKWQTSTTVSGTVFHSDLMSEIPENSKYKSDPCINGKGASVMFSFENRNFSIASGIAFSRYAQNFSASAISYNPSVHLQIINSGSITEVDSVSSWHYYYLADSIVHLVDSVLEWKEVTNTIYLFDSVYVPQSDTLSNIHWKISFDKFEVPVIVGLSKSFGRFQFGLHSGISLDLIKPVCGYLYNGKFAVLPFRNVNESFSDLYLALSFHVSTSMSFVLNERLVFDLRPYYKMQLNDINLPEQNLNLKFRSYGISAGFKYYF